MVAPDITEPLVKLLERLKTDAALIAIVPADNIRTHLPQTTADGSYVMPWIKVEWEPGANYSSKSHQGFNGRFRFSIWTDKHSIAIPLAAAQRINGLLHSQPLDLAEGNCLLLQHDQTRTVNEPDGTNSVRMTFVHLLTEK